MPTILCAHGAHAGFGLFLFPVAALVKDKEKSESHGFEYVVDLENDQITYKFRHDSSFHYTHKYSNILSYLRQSHVVHDSRTYVLEMFSVRGDASYFQVVESIGGEMPSENLHSVWLSYLGISSWSVCKRLRMRTHPTVQRTWK